MTDREIDATFPAYNEKVHVMDFEKLHGIEGRLIYTQDSGYNFLWLHARNGKIYLVAQDNPAALKQTEGL